MGGVATGPPAPLPPPPPPPGKEIGRRLGEPHCGSGQVRKIAPSPGFFLFSLCTLSVLLCPHFPAFCLFVLTVQHTTQTSILSAGFEPSIPATDRPQTLALDHSVTGIGGIRSSDRPVRRGPLYRLIYRGPSYFHKAHVNQTIHTATTS